MLHILVFGLIILLLGIVFIVKIDWIVEHNYVVRQGIDDEGRKNVKLSIFWLGVFNIIIGLIMTILSIAELTV